MINSTNEANNQSVLSKLTEKITSPKDRKLQGQVAIITGAARGIGRACALHLAGLGATIVINDINLDSAKEVGEQLSAPSVAEECQKFDVEAIGIQADMSQQTDVNHMIQRVCEQFSRIDIMVNNAGGALVPMEHSFASRMPEDEYRAVFDCNLTTTILGCQAVIPIMKQQGSGRIVNFSSQASRRVRENGSLAHYSIAKAAVSHYTRILAAEVGQHGIHVNAVAPGLILTQRAIVKLGRANEPFKSETESHIPLRRMGVPEDVAKVVEFLVTDLSNYVTGQVISVCGGNVLWGI